MNLSNRACSFVYVERFGPHTSIGRDVVFIRHLAEAGIKQITSDQGGIDWHVSRSALGAITSTVASIFLRLCQGDLREEHRDLLRLVGIAPVRFDNL